MAVCLTGDVHHMSMKGKDQQYLEGTELGAAIEYAGIAKNFKVSVTFFLTGKSVKEEKEIAEKLSSYPNVKLGGHTYNAFKPKWLYNGGFTKFFRQANGPFLYQNWEIKKAIRTLREISTEDIISWRDHGYRYDSNTFQLLAKNGIKVVSDIRDPKSRVPYKENEGLFQAPINTLPDHDHLIHGPIREDFYEGKNYKNHPFSPEVYPAEQWLERVKKQVESLTGHRDSIATLLVHPACMKIVDNFETFKKLCRFLTNYESINMEEIPQKYSGGKKLG